MHKSNIKVGDTVFWYGSDPELEYSGIVTRIYEHMDRVGVLVPEAKGGYCAGDFLDINCPYISHNLRLTNGQWSNVPCFKSCASFGPDPENEFNVLGAVYHYNASKLGFHNVQTWLNNDTWEQVVEKIVHTLNEHGYHITKNG